MSKEDNNAMNANESDNALVDKLEKDYEYNSNRPNIDSRKERKALHEMNKKRRNTPTSELDRPAKASRLAAKATLHLGERVKDTDILREMEE